MDEIARLMEWDLQAIAGCTIVMDNPAAHLSFSHFCSEQHDHLLWNFHEFSETTTVVNELEELYKPFYPVGSNSIITSSQPVPELKTKEVKDKVIVQNLQDPAASKCKTSKKKEKNKRVEHVTGEDGVWDQWAWRKYGQKPIKGSTYPRSYYRCSSSKGCFARKQVERSHLDHSVFIVTYTAEHSHPHPTRKNSQARNTAKKNRSTSVLLSPGTSVPVVVDSIAHEHAPSVELEQGKGAKKEKGNSWTLYGQE